MPFFVMNVSGQWTATVPGTMNHSTTSSNSSSSSSDSNEDDSIIPSVLSVVGAVMMDEYNTSSDDEVRKWGGSKPGKSPNIEQDFEVYN